MRRATRTFQKNLEKKAEMEFWLIGIAVMTLVVIVAIAGAVMSSLLISLSRLSEDDHDYIKDWNDDGNKRKR